MIAPNPRAARAARLLVRAALSDWSLPHLVEDATLVATELVSNAIRSAEAISLEVSLEAGSVRVEVFDTSRELPKKGEGRLLDEHGKGLLLVEALAADWGYRLVRGGKVVWARCGPASS
ncbi:ATP-binding protein [Actinomadura craniellae]|uniref:ATP-binding protein n=2 Tax=Actinomadura craniellae TaxID=2231787 RepID=A0A365HAC9_9ACTN|nr:ATP-binding protein [Actinomadura craniellae]